MNSHDPFGDEPVQLPVEACLDLHTFRPQDVREVVEEYLRLCQEKGLLRVRIVHGKGTGALRTTVHALLDRHPQVAGYTLAGELLGGWGATIVTLRPPRDPAARHANPGKQS